MKSFKKLSILNSLKIQPMFFANLYTSFRPHFSSRAALTTFLLLCCNQLTLAADSYPAAGGPITITPLVHSSVQLEYQDLVIQVDPWSISGLPSAKKADLILVTDSPGHHLDPDAIAQLRTPMTSIIIAANGEKQIPDGIVMANGETLKVAGVTIKAVAAYDIILGAPEHPKGDANGYVITLGEKKLFFGGVTECVDEVKALSGIDVAFVPLNIPRERMTPAAAAECTKLLDPELVYTYHYDQEWARSIANPDFERSLLPGGLTVEQSLDAFEAELSGSGIEYKRPRWYPSAN
jgi:L-ascorbate metabolism protein UlaG (beta-lactamase superfamily)